LLVDLVLLVGLDQLVEGGRLTAVRDLRVGVVGQRVADRVRRVVQRGQVGGAPDPGGRLDVVPEGDQQPVAGGPDLGRRVGGELALVLAHHGSTNVYQSPARCRYRIGSGPFGFPTSGRWAVSGPSGR